MKCGAYRGVVWGGVGVLLAVSAAGHTRSQSFSTWRATEEGVEATFSMLAREVTRLPEAATGTALDVLYARHLAANVRARRGGEDCLASAPARPLRARPGHVRAELRFRCPAQGALEIESAALVEQAPSHVHFARWVAEDGTSREHLITDARRRRVLDAGSDDEEAAGASFAGYVALGVEHILRGADHVAFLLALLLLGGRLRDVLLVVTGFTLGHSLTLSLAVLGWVRVDAAVVEALIGFSIALVAAENLAVRSGAQASLARAGGALLAGLALLAAWRGLGPPGIALAGLALFTFCYLRLAESAEAARRYRPAVTTLFGLVHGFGFATLLLEIGLPRARVAAGLLGFNVGVELGQVALVLAWLAVARAGIALAPARRWTPAADILSAALCAVGTFWFASRGWG